MIPTVAAPESTVGLVRDGYTFISRRCDCLGTDAFRARLMLRPAVCMRGPDAARVFYADDERFTRRGAMPTSLLRLLQDEGSAQWLDGSAHRHRKDMFLGLLTGDTAPLLEAFDREWRAAIPRWRAGGEVVLHDELEELLTRVDRPRGVPPTNWWARALRRRCERWASTLVDGVRAGELGAGDLATTHRCPGEPATVALVAQAVRLLTRSVRYRVGVQDLTVGLNLADAPPKPRDGFRIQDVMPA